MLGSLPSPRVYVHTDVGGGAGVHVHMGGVHACIWKFIHACKACIRVTKKRGGVEASSLSYSLGPLGPLRDIEETLPNFHHSLPGINSRR